MLLRHPSSRTSDYQVPRLRSALHLLPRPPLVLPIRPSPGVLELHSRQSHVLRVAPAVPGHRAYDRDASIACTTGERAQVKISGGAVQE